MLAKNSFEVRQNLSSKCFVDSHGTAQLHPARDGTQFWDVRVIKFHFSLPSVKKSCAVMVMSSEIVAENQRTYVH